MLPDHGPESLSMCGEPSSLARELLTVIGPQGNLLTLVSSPFPTPDGRCPDRRSSASHSSLAVPDATPGPSSGDRGPFALPNRTRDGFGRDLLTTVGSLIRCRCACPSLPSEQDCHDVTWFKDHQKSNNSLTTWPVSTPGTGHLSAAVSVPRDDRDGLGLKVPNGDPKGLVTSGKERDDVSRSIGIHGRVEDRIGDYMALRKQVRVNGVIDPRRATELDKAVLPLIIDVRLLIKTQRHVNACLGGAEGMDSDRAEQSWKERQAERAWNEEFEPVPA